MSAMNKPRHSILTLFDPLKTPLTPRSDTCDFLDSSDKENDAPPGEMTLFFKRIYDARKPCAPKPPAGTLIDYEDALTDEPLPVATDDEDEEAENMGMERERLKEMAVPASKRQPLVDIDLQLTPKPRSQTHTQPSSVLSAARAEEPLPAPVLTAAPADAPLSDVINSINMTSCSISDPPSSPLSQPSPLSACIYLASDDEHAGGDDPFPVITVAPAPSSTSSGHNVMASPHLCSPALHDSLSDERSPRVRRRSPKDRVQDPRRMSCDLQSSFNMHLDSADMSFNLLNDRISFLSTEHDSMWAGQDDDFSPKPQKPEMKTLLERHDATESASSTSDDPTSSPPTEEELHAKEPEGLQPQVPSTDRLFKMPEGAERSTVPDFSDEPPFFLGVPEEPTAEQAIDAVAQVIEQPPMAVPQTPAESKLVAHVTGSAMPAPRAVKKTLKIHTRTNSAATTAGRRPSVSAPSYTGATSASAARRSSVGQITRPSVIGQVPKRVGTQDGLQIAASKVATETKPAPDTVAPARRVIRGVQRPPIPPNAVTAPLKTTFSGVADKRRESVTPTGRPAVAGLQRPSVSQGSTTATAASKARQAVPGAAAVKPPAATIASKASTTGLKPPTRYGTATAATAIPRPASRLPTTGSGGSLTSAGAAKRTATVAKSGVATTDVGKAATLRKGA